MMFYGVSKFWEVIPELAVVFLFSSDFWLNTPRLYLFCEASLVLYFEPREWLLFLVPPLAICFFVG